MPSVLTHYGFNKEVFNNKIEFLKNNEDIYLVGAQGPDPFFFYGIVPFLKARNAKEVRKYGTTLHKREPSKVFSFFFEYALKEEDKDILFSYILGAGLHYILDRKVHPYVFYKTGFSEDSKMKRKYFVDHTLFETHMDVLLMNNRYKSYKVKPSDSIKCDKDKIEEVSEMYEKLAKDIVVEKMMDDDSFEDAYEHMVKIEKILYSKRGIKKGIINLLFKNTPFNTMMHPRRVKDDKKIDYLNLKRNEWKDPASEIKFNKSIDDLIEEAKEEVREWEDIVVSAYNGEISLNRLEKFTRNMIYDGYDSKMKMKVFKSVYRKEKE